MAREKREESAGLRRPALIGSATPCVFTCKEIQMKREFYDLCERARDAALKKKPGEALGFLTQAWVIAKKETEFARMRIEISVCQVYMGVIKGTAMDCGYFLGLRPQGPLFLSLLGECPSALGRAEHHRSSLDYRLKYAEYPESYLPFMWPRHNCSELGSL